MNRMSFVRCVRAFEADEDSLLRGATQSLPTWFHINGQRACHSARPAYDSPDTLSDQVWGRKCKSCPRYLIGSTLKVSIEIVCAAATSFGSDPS